MFAGTVNNFKDRRASDLVEYTLCEGLTSVILRIKGFSVL